MVEGPNNFFGYMPGGFYRDVLERCRPDELQDEKRLVAAIDAYLTQIGFDVPRYMKIQRILLKSRRKFAELFTNRQDKEAEHHSKRIQGIRKLEYELSKPVYDGMLALGFSRTLLEG